MNASSIALAGARGHISSRDCVQIDNKTYCSVRKEKKSAPGTGPLYGGSGSTPDMFLLVVIVVMVALFVAIAIGAAVDADAKQSKQGSAK